MRPVNVSICVGKKAIPQVRDALTHFEENPEHNPWVALSVDKDGRQCVRWWCQTCDPIVGEIVNGSRT